MQLSTRKEGLGSVTVDKIRNVSIIAHVDHGKTSLADCLISSNGFISTRMAGKMRFMDYREDEQTRGITMKTSAITLLYNSLIVTLIDSPGHVDFAGEVSSALLISDIGLLVIDMIEGVCPQTEFLLRQAVTLNLDLILVFNKLDRLFVELKLTVNEVCSHIHRLMEQVNSCMSRIIGGTLVEMESWKTMDETERLHYFRFEGNNVIFASALHGYGFSLVDFASIWSPKLNLSSEELRKSLITDSYLSKGVIKQNAMQLGKKSLFEQLIIQPLWDLHKCGLASNDLNRLMELASKINVTVKSKRITEAFDELMRSWLPLSQACFRAIRFSQSPLQSFKRPNRLSSIGIIAQSELHTAISSCCETDTVVVFVTKILAYGTNVLAMCRILCGSVKGGDQLYLIDDRRMKHNGLRITVNRVSLLMGREQLLMETAKAGMVCGIEIKGRKFSSFMCSESIGHGIKFPHDCDPLVRVILHSEGKTDEWDDLREKLEHLCALDSSIRVIVQKTGDLALQASGEVHLQKCLIDLFGMGEVNVRVSEPTVSFMETIVPSGCGDESVVETSACGDIRIKLRAVPLPVQFTKLLEKFSGTLNDMRQGILESVDALKLQEALLTDGVKWLKGSKGTWWCRQSEASLKSLMSRIWALGPPSAMYNVLFNAVPQYNRQEIWNTKSTGIQADIEQHSCFDFYDGSVRTGFSLEMSSGPLCEEPMWGIAIVLEMWDVKQSEERDLYGSHIALMRKLCREALKKQALRLILAMYKCNIQANSSVLGKVHAVLSQRGAKVIHEDINQTSGLFSVEAFIPVIESFLFCEHLRKKTSGLALGQLEFSHWETLAEDPYWEPKTEDEVELHGTKSDSRNKARYYIELLRKRKGLLVDEPLVVDGTKQRNLSRNK